VNTIRTFKSEVQNNILTVGILGRITYARNPSFFNSIAAAHPEVSFKWIGDGELRDLITAPNIEVTGWFTNKEDAYYFLNTIDVYLQTSLWEGLPIALLEAMALEKPIIATNIIGNKDVVNHGVTGYLINDLEDFSKSIELLKDKNKRKKMGDAALKRVTKEFNSETNFETLIDFYLQQISNRH
jgi:glycosyltransferase involved in cell wall biosynthesis